MTCLQLDLNATAADSRTPQASQQAACHLFYCYISVSYVIGRGFKWGGYAALPAKFAEAGLRRDAL
jgi:hypothetical protein